MSRHKARLTPEQREEIARRRQAGEGLQALATEFGITRQGVDLIAKRQSRTQDPAAKPRALTSEEFAWLRQQLQTGTRDAGDKWSQAAVKKLVAGHFGCAISIKRHQSSLRELGVKVGGDASDDEPELPPDFHAYVNSPLAQQIRERQEALHRWEMEQRRLNPPRRGRPRKEEPVAPILEDDECDDGLNDVDDFSLDAVRASVAATRAEMKPASPAPPPPLPAHGVRTGKHAGAYQPPKRKKKRRR